ncbi:MAG TPA: hypothetical protein DGN60_03510 [Chloroflexi bacterium]|nr:hypothetical protein [Chloroflexota bacterium]|tara:strand:+ start:246 stop:479 length:234 start_codon:yes stop_codon:yes gene_type:complete
MAKPDYATLLSQIAAASGDAKTALEAQCYVFEEELTDAEKDLFNYVSDEYFLFNPGTENETFKSYVGVYYSATGETT